MSAYALQQHAYIDFGRREIIDATVVVEVPRSVFECREHMPGERRNYLANLGGCYLQAEVALWFRQFVDIKI